MTRLARAGFVVSLVLALLIVGKEFPFDPLLHGHSAVAASSRELASLEQADKSLSQQITKLEQPATVGSIAHAEYGLVPPGQSYEVVLPGAGRHSSGQDPLADNPLPRSAIVPSDAAVSSPPGTAGEPSTAPSFWSRLMARLEFWKASS